MPHPILELAQLLQQRSKIPLTNSLTAFGATPSPTPTIDPYAQAVTQAMQQFPWLKRMNAPIKLVAGKGPYMSESYMPKSEENPNPGNYTVQLRDPKIVNDPKTWAPLLGREGIDWMARTDPVYQDTAKQFRASMTDDQLKRSRRRYDSDPGIQKDYTFDQFLTNAELQEYIGGYVLDMPGWKDKGGWTPQQRQLLDGLKQYLWQGQKPVPANIP